MLIFLPTFYYIETSLFRAERHSHLLTKLTVVIVSLNTRTSRRAAA